MRLPLSMKIPQNHCSMIFNKQKRDYRGDERLRPSASLALTGLCLSMLIPSLDTSIANASLPLLLRAFDASFPQVQWIVLSYLLAITALVVSVGRLGDLVGRRRLLLAGLVIFNAASLLCGIAPSLWFLIAARAMQGLGAAIMMSLTIAFASETVSKGRVGSTMGLLGTMSAIGTTLGPSVGGILTSAFGWRMIFIVNVPLGVLNFVFAYRYLPSDNHRSRAERAVTFDKKGTGLLVVTLIAYCLALTLDSSGPMNIALLLAAVFGGALFLRVERRETSPLIELSMLRKKALGGGLAMSAFVTTVMMATLIVGPFYLSGTLRLDTAVVGIVLSIGPLAAAVFGVPSGRVADRFGANTTTLFGLLGLGVGCFALAVIPVSSGVAGYVVPIVVMTTSYAMFQAANNTRVMTGIDVDRRGAVSGMLSLSRNLGLITGASVMGALFAGSIGSSDVASAGSDAIATGLHFTFAAATVLILIAIMIWVGSQSAVQTSALQEV